MKAVSEDKGQVIPHPMGGHAALDFTTLVVELAIDICSIWPSALCAERIPFPRLKLRSPLVGPKQPPVRFAVLAVREH